MAIYTIQLKRGRSSSWITLNPILAPGEPGYEIDTGKLKIGNGIDEWINLKYLGEDKALVVNANTYIDFPAIGDAGVLYKASQEKQLYQWNEQTNEYEILLRSDFVTHEQLREIIEKIEIPEVALKDYATKAYVQETLDMTMIPLTKEEISDICKEKQI